MKQMTTWRLGNQLKLVVSYDVQAYGARELSTSQLVLYFGYIFLLDGLQYQRSWVHVVPAPVNMTHLHIRVRNVGKVKDYHSSIPEEARNPARHIEGINEQGDPDGLQCTTLLLKDLLSDPALLCFLKEGRIRQKLFAVFHQHSVPKDQKRQVGHDTANRQEPEILIDAKVLQALEDPVPEADIEEAAAPDCHEAEEKRARQHLSVKFQPIVQILVLWEPLEELI